MSNTNQELLDHVMAVVEELEGSAEYDNIYDWLDEQLNIEGFSIRTDGTFKGAEILVACGGPDIRVYTATDTVVGCWGGDEIIRSYNDTLGLEGAMQEHYNAVKGDF